MEVLKRIFILRGVPGDKAQSFVKNEKHLKKISLESIIPNNIFPKEGVELLDSMLMTNPEKRFTAK